MSQRWTEEQLFDYYQNTFRKIYGDLVAVIGNKPLEISFEIEAVMSHLGVAKTHGDPKIQEDNISKAAGHLQRATLDAVKILWLEFRSRSEAIMDDDLIRKFCSRFPEHEFVRRYNKAETLAIEARRKEIQNVGVNPEESVMAYYEAANEYRNLVDAVDWERVQSIKTFRWAHYIKQHLIGFAIGVISSALVAVLTWKYLPPSPTAQAADKPAVAITLPRK